MLCDLWTHFYEVWYATVRKLRLISLTFHHNHRFKRKKHTRHCTSPTEEGVWSISHLNIISLPDLAREPIKIHLVLATKCDMLNCKSFFFSPPDGKPLSSPPSKILLWQNPQGGGFLFYFSFWPLASKTKISTCCHQKSEFVNTVLSTHYWPTNLQW